jgi:two-component system cell cycle response regulator
MNARILVVDDNALNRKLACDLLSLEGYRVQQAADALEALELLAAGAPPDLVLMDISLPGMDGLTLTRQLKSQPRYAAMPVVALTAFAMKGDEEKAYAAGCSGYITKPIDTRRFPQLVAQALQVAIDARQPLRIMVVEDHRIDMKLIGAGATLSGHVVLSNTTAEQALVSLGSGHPDVVLLDLNLPGMNGLEFLQLLRADPLTRELPVVAMTAYPDEDQRRLLVQQLLHELQLAWRQPPGTRPGTAPQA